MLQRIRIVSLNADVGVVNANVGVVIFLYILCSSYLCIMILVYNVTIITNIISFHNYMNLILSGPLRQFLCGSSNWKAARNTVNRQSKLDETGLIVAGCRHSLAQAAVNMHQGKLYGYTHYLQVNRLVLHNVKFLWQDVICKYWPWFTSLPKDLSPAEAFSMAPALSIMHGKAHVWSCQVEYSY